MNKTRRIVLIATVTLLVAALLSTAIVLADTWKYRTKVTVVNDLSSARENLLISIDIEGQNLIDAGFVNADATDTRLKEGTDDRKFLVCDDKILFFLPSLATYQEKDFYFYMGYLPKVDSFSIIIGHDGYVTIAYNETLELGDTFAIAVEGYFDTSDGENKNIIRKDSAILLSITDDKEITFAITGGPSLVATDIDSAAMEILILADGGEVWMEIDGDEQDRKAVIAVPIIANNWTLFENNVCPYVTYFGIWIV